MNPNTSIMKYLLNPFWTQRIVTPLAALAAMAALLSSAQAQTPTLVVSSKWSLAAGSRADLPAANNTERGIAINKLTGNVLFASRTGSNHVAVVSGIDGSDKSCGCQLLRGEYRFSHGNSDRRNPEL